MKKTLHGMRHVRARASVRIGRDKRKIRKFNRFIKAATMTIRRLGDAIIAAMEIWADALRKASEVFAAIGDKIDTNKESQ